jgi:hypothetical protein
VRRPLVAALVGEMSEWLSSSAASTCALPATADRSRYGGQVAASAGHLAVARYELTREQRRMKEHAWKSDPFTRSKAYQDPPTQFPPTTSLNIDVRRHVPVNDGLHQGFRGVCDTVLTQRESALAPHTHGRKRCRSDAHSNRARS